MVRGRTVFLWVSWLLFGLLAACQNNAPLPTAIPVARAPTSPPPTATNLPPPTLDLTALTAVPPEQAQQPATATAAEPAPPTAVLAGLTITTPEANADLLLGSELLVQGLVRSNSDQSIWAALLTLNGRLLVEVPAIIGDASWQAALTIPSSVNGAAILQASVRDPAGNVVAAGERPVNLVLNSEESDRFLVLFRPVAGDPAMAGYNFFFDGRAQRPANSTVTISIWAENCQTQVAKQSFVLRGSGYWQGFVILPANTNAGPGCAIAAFGEPGSAKWREVQVPIHIYANEDQDVHDIRIGNPPPDRQVTAGDSFLVYGTALNASEAPILVSVLLENGRVLAEEEITTDYWGYWEIPVNLPEDVSGTAVITAVPGPFGSETGAEDRTIITIVPAPKS